MELANSTRKVKVITANTTATPNVDYICNSSSTIVVTVPATCAAGLSFSVTAKGNTKFFIAPYDSSTSILNTVFGYACFDFISSSVTVVCVTDNTGYVVISNSSDSTVATAFLYGLFSGTYYNAIHKINLVTKGSSTLTGYLSTFSSSSSSIGGNMVSSKTRGVYAQANYSGQYVTIEYMNFFAEGTSADFGDLVYGRPAGGSGLSSATRGMFCYGSYSSTYYSSIEYVTMATTGNSSIFGYCIGSSYGLSNAASFSSPTRGVLAGGKNYTTVVNTIEYVTIATLGNSVDFGDIPSTCYSLGGCSSSTVGVFAGGYNSLNNGQTSGYTVTIATTANATLINTVYSATQKGLSSNIYGYFYGSSSNSNTIQYMSFANYSVVSDFSYFSVAGNPASGCTNSHGGLQ